MEEQFRVIMDALAEIDRQAREERATLDRVRMCVATLVGKLNSPKTQSERLGLYFRAFGEIQDILRTKPAGAPLKLVKP